MAEQANMAQRPGFAQQLEPIFTDLRLSRRSLRSQPRPTPPEPDFTQDLTVQSSQRQPEASNVLAFRRAAP
ncbi:MAG: hypothetical protein ACAI44_28090 [Candidatus Sericytochromatia bacterium]